MFNDVPLFRCHQSYLINLSKVVEVSQSEFGRTYSTIMNDGSRVPVSRGRYATMKEQMRQKGVQII